MYGPIATELYTPGKHYIWCAGEMMHKEEVADYAYNDFWSSKPKYIRWFFKLLSRIIPPLSVCVFNNAHTIGVYHDMRIMETFKESVELLGKGARVVIFPESSTPHNSIVYEFQDKFIDMARTYHKATGKPLAFVPMYLAPKLKKMVFGGPIYFDMGSNPGEERKRVSNALMDSITNMARSLPAHTVIPYPNMPPKKYPKNIESKTDEMKRQMYDYKGFSLKKLTDPRFSHVLLLLGWVIYFIFFFITENFIPEERLHEIHCHLDDVIPFNEYFLIFYGGWYLLIAGSLLFTLLYEVETFKNIQKFIIITQACGNMVTHWVRIIRAPMRSASAPSSGSMNISSICGANANISPPSTTATPAPIPVQVQNALRTLLYFLAPQQ